MDAPTDPSWDEIHQAMIPLMRADPRINIVYIAREYALIALALAAGASAHRAWMVGGMSSALFIPIAGLVIAASAALQHRLSGLAHEASHFILFRDRLANELASDLLLMFPLVAMTQRYRAAHLGHHRFVNDPRRDPDLVRLNHPEPHRFPIEPAAFWRRYVVRGLWPPSILRYLAGRFCAANLPVESEVPVRTIYRARVARCLRASYWLSALAIVHALGGWPIFFLFWVTPLLTIYPLLMQLREIAHHSNAPDDGDLTNSRVFRIHPLLSACVFPYGQAFHQTHHLFAMIPHHRVAEADAILRRHPAYRDAVTVCRGYFFRRDGGPSVLDVLSRKPAASLAGPHFGVGAGGVEPAAHRGDGTRVAS